MIQKLMSKFFSYFEPNKTKRSRQGNVNNIKLSVFPSPEDKRDKKHSAETPFLVRMNFPKKFSLKEKCPEVKYQGSIGSCGSHAICNALEIVYKKRKTTYKGLSELFHYWCVRQPEYMNTYPKDTGQYLREGLKTAQTEGICFENYHPYKVKDLNKTPEYDSQFCAMFFRLKKYKRCYKLENIVQELSKGNPVIAGIKVNSEFMYLTNKKYRKTNSDYLGGHAVTIIGYDNETMEFEILNSWGKTWADKGFCKISYPDFREIFFEAWSIYG